MQTTNRMEVVRENRLHWADMVVITAYFGISLSVGVWVIIRFSNSSGYYYYIWGSHVDVPLYTVYIILILVFFAIRASILGMYEDHHKSTVIS